MIDPGVGHVGDVQQAVNSTQVNKGTKIGDVLDHAFANLANFQFIQQFLLGILSLFFNQASTTDNDIAALLINFENFTLNDLANIVADVPGPSDVDLAGRQEDLYANVHQQTALDLSRTGSCNDVVFINLGDYITPVNDVVSFDLAQAD